MKVKIGDEIYDSHDQPIMIILTQQAKENIHNMSPEMLKYCEYPSDIPIREIENFMEIG